MRWKEDDDVEASRFVHREKIHKTNYFMKLQVCELKTLEIIVHRKKSTFEQFLCHWILLSWLSILNPSTNDPASLRRRRSSIGFAKSKKYVYKQTYRHTCKDTNSITDSVLAVKTGSFRQKRRAMTLKAQYRARALTRPISPYFSSSLCWPSRFCLDPCYIAEQRKPFLKCVCLFALLIKRKRSEGGRSLL